MSDRASLLRLLREFRAEQREDKAADLESAIVGLFDDVREELYNECDRLEETLAFHPRAAKLMRKRKNFLVVAEDETYFADVYLNIRIHERQKGTWTDEDEERFMAAWIAYTDAKGDA